MKTLSRLYVPLVFQPQTDHAENLVYPVALGVLGSPLRFFMKTEGPERDPTWVQSLPNEAQRCFCKHALEIASGQYDPEIKGGVVFNCCGQI